MRNSNIYTITFVLIMSLLVALLLAGVSQALKPLQEANQVADMKKNILSSVGIKVGSGECSSVESCYVKNIRSIVVNSSGEIIKGDAENIDLQSEITKAKGKQQYPVFIRIKDDKPVAYCVPVVGKGLWGTVWGYVALETDLSSIKGITFYKHVETPGLGAEIATDWFTKGYVNKKITDKDGKFVSVSIVKGKVKTDSPMKAHEVDGISGATITCDAVNLFVKEKLGLYEPYFKKLRKVGE